MRVLLVLVSFAAVAFAGVGKLTKEQETEIAEIYKSICSDNREGGEHKDTPVFCKFPKDAPKEVKKEHEVKADGAGSTSSQIVFIRPLSNVYKHTVTLLGTSENKQNTSIYVLPAKDQHEIDITDKRNSTSKAEKPHLYYLTKDPIADEEQDAQGTDQQEQDSATDGSASTTAASNGSNGNGEKYLPPKNLDDDTKITYSVSQS